MTITGLNVREGENTDDTVINSSRKMDLNESEKLTGNDLDHTHPLGDKVIVKFTSYNARHTFLKHRKELGENIFVNEHLTKQRRQLLYECRQLKRQNKLQATWTNDGTVKIKMNNGRNCHVKTIEDVKKLLQQNVQNEA